MTRLPVAIVGRAWRTPLGATVEDAIARVLAGERAATAGARTAGYACTLVAPILGEPAKSRQSRFLRRLGLFGLEVAQQAFRSAKEASPFIASTDGTRVGLFAGVGGLRAHWDDMLKALEDQDEAGTNAWERGLRDVHPYWMLRHLSNNVHALAAMELGLKGEGATYGGATGGAQALAAAARALHDGAIDAALVVAYDSLLEPETLVELGAKRAATRETDVGRVASPYDVRAAGFVPGEAAAAVVLTRVADASSPIAVVAAADGADGEREEAGIAVIRRALTSVSRNAGADANASALAFVDGAARAWPERDAAERSMLGDLGIAHGTPLTAITASLGQLGAATAVVQAIALAELLRRRTAPPIASLANAAPGPLVPLSRATAISDRAALALSTGAPGLAAAIRVEVP